MSKATAKNVIGGIGRAVISERLNVTKGAVNAAYNNGEHGIMPASWYLAVKALGDEIGLNVPYSAFNWKAPPPLDEFGDIIQVTSYQ